MIASDAAPTTSRGAGRVLLIGLAPSAPCSPSPWCNSCRQRLTRA